MILDPVPFEVRLMHARCQLQHGDFEEFIKAMCAPTDIAVLNVNTRFEVYHLVRLVNLLLDFSCFVTLALFLPLSLSFSFIGQLLLGWASASKDLKQANEFAIKCENECIEGDRRGFDEIRPHIADPSKAPHARLEANRNALGGAKGLEYHRMFKKRCVPFLRKQTKQGIELKKDDL